MSRSSLWGIDKNFYGKKIAEYGNSWLYSPIVWDVLGEKYLRTKESIIFNRNNFEYLNYKVDNCGFNTDRINWELSMSQIFSSKDSIIVSAAIVDFANSYERYCDGILCQDHIKERFYTIADDIRNIDYEYFVFKNTSVDDNVERWFWNYEEEKECRLHDCNSEFVVITGRDITDFIPAKDYMRKKHE